MDFKDKSVIVTGGGSGIGKGICVEFAEHGANVAVCDINYEAAKKVADELSQKGVQSIAIKVDVTNEQDAANMVEETVKAFGSIDVICNNAGIIKAMKPLEQLTVEEWDQNFDVNAKSVFICSKAVIPQMRKQGYGRILNTASQCGKTGTPNLGHYCAAKAAVILFTKTLALELAKTNIHVNAVCPGSVDTEMTDRETVIISKMTGEDPAVIKKKWESAVPMGRYAKPKDIAKVFVFLASEYADYMTGQAINVSGGQEMH